MVFAAVGPMLGLFFSAPAQQLPDKLGPRLEITEVDLFARDDWNSERMSVLGFTLGMGRWEVLKVAQRQSLQLDDELGQPCLQGYQCHVMRSGEYAGVSLRFNRERELLDGINVELLAADRPRHERISWIARQFRGATSEFVQGYSENLQIRLLGHANATRYGGDEKEYAYERRGLIVRTRFFKRRHLFSSPDVARVEIEFVSRK